MAHLLVKHTVKNFDAWKQVFDEHEPTRRASGSKGAQVLRSADAPNDVVLLFDWDSADNARKFTGSEDLRTTMQRAGVQGAPEVLFLDEVARPTA